MFKKIKDFLGLNNREVNPQGDLHEAFSEEVYPIVLPYQPNPSQPLYRVSNGATNNE